MVGKRKTTSKKNGKDADSKSAKSVTGSSAGESVITLCSKLNIGNVSALVSDLKDGLDAEGPIKIDLNNVEQADTAAFQVLVSFANTGMNLKREIQWRGESEQLKRFAKILAIDSYLEFDSCEPSDDLCPVF